MKNVKQIPDFIPYVSDEYLHTHHYEYCIQYKLPFISIQHIGKNKSEIFYDITHFNVDLETISHDVKELFFAYKKFFLLDDYFGENYLDQYYFFRFPVQTEHSDCIASQLFKFLIHKI